MRQYLLALLALSAPSLWAGTYTAATCSRSDVNAVINGPTHTAVDGDVIQIPSGSCTWTSGITVSTQTVTISTSTGGATLCYTTDGTTPTADGALANNGV